MHFTNKAFLNRNRARNPGGMHLAGRNTAILSYWICKALKLQIYMYPHEFIARTFLAVQ